MAGAETRAALYDAFARYTSGMTLVTVRDGDHDRFFVAGSVLTASVDPFALTVSVGNDRDALPAMGVGGKWTLSVLGVQHRELVEALIGDTTREERFLALAEAGAEASPSGSLWLPDVSAAFWCRTTSLTPVNNQTLVTGDVTGSQLGEQSLPLIRWNHGFKTTAEVS